MSWNLSCQVCSAEYVRWSGRTFLYAKKEVTPGVWHTVYLCTPCYDSMHKQGWEEDLDLHNTINKQTKQG